MTEETDNHEQILLARQPIYNLDLEIIGYELLFRPSKTLVNKEAWCPDLATSDVVLQAFTELNSSLITDDKVAFINFTRKLILDTPKLKPSDIVIEVLEDLEPDQELKKALDLLCKVGYTIALDDFVYSSEWDDIIELAKYIKVDVLSLSKEQIREQVELLKPFDVILLAEKVEDHDMFEYCKSLGFTYFQGYFLCRPQCVKGRKLPTSRLTVLNLLAELQNDDIEISHLQKIVARDPSLSTKLLKIFEASSYAHLPKIESIHHAITLIGLKQLRSWVNLISLSKLEDKPHALLLTALNRARFCEELAVKAGKKNLERYFTVGLFSLLDAFFEIPLDDIVSRLPLSEELVEALLKKSGNLGPFLKFAINYERANWEKLDKNFVETNNLTVDSIEEAYFDSIAWASDVSKNMFQS